VSLVSANRVASEQSTDVWARLIPGEDPAFWGKRKKPSQSVQRGSQEIPSGRASEEKDGALGLLLPKPLQKKVGKQWAQGMSLDFALIAINWLAIGALLVPLRVVFPYRRVVQFDAGRPLSLLGLAVLHAALITLIGYTEGIHARGCELRIQRRILAKSVMLATMVLCVGYELQGAPWSIAMLFCAAGSLHFAVLLMWRKAQQSSVMAQPCDTRMVLIVGAGPVGRRVASYLEQHPSSGRAVYGFLDDLRPLGNGVLGRVGELAQIARRGFVEEIILAGPCDRELTNGIFQEACQLRLDVEVVPELFGYDPAAEVEEVDGLPVICIHAEQLPAVGLVLKRISDVIGATLALLLLSPLIGFIAAVIKLDSAGSVLYSAARAGRKGQLFRCHKFRTMVSNADQLKNSLRQNNQRSGPFFKITGDPRITRVGRLLRRFSLDELPQLLNVLKGEMSLVGPRPHPLDDVAGYELEHLARLDVTPGITGLWQVTARRDPSFQRGMELDREYIRTWSLGLDLRILWKTFAAVLQGSGE
jgi:exopolysaccharide biosynthesis polyprenyl glycosylphosphotransferase